MKQHDVTEERAYDLLNTLVEDAWKDLNRESLICKEIPMVLKMRVINLTCFVDTMYKYEDTFTHVGAELIGYIKAHFIHPMSI